MEYSIYINQKAAVAWKLSMAESIMFGYLISSGGWMASLAESPDYRWASNSKLATELPLVCAHKGSARRHMKSLEEKGLIDRITADNKSYFRITEKGNYWRSDTLPKTNETVELNAQGERNGSPRANETVDPRANETVDQSDKPYISDIPISEKRLSSDSQANAKPDSKKITKVQQQLIIALYHEILPELSSVVVSRWHDSKHAKALAKRWSENKKFQSMDFWQTFFETVRHNSWWMGLSDNPGGQTWKKCNLAWLVTRSNFDKVIQLGLDLEQGK